MVGVGGDLAEAGVERGDDALAVDQPQEARDRHPEARVRAHALAVASEYVIHGLAHDLSEGRPVERVAEGACQGGRSEEHTSELQSLAYLVCRLLLEKKKKTQQ